MNCPTCRTPWAAQTEGAPCPRCSLALALRLSAADGDGDAAAAAGAPEVPRAGEASAAAESPPSPVEPGAPGRIGGYDLLHEIGRGGMGVVWLARERALDRLVALKVIAPGADPGLAARLLREGQAAARLHHRHIVSIHALGGVGGAGTTPFLAMDFLDGGNLEQRLAGRGLPGREAAELAAKLAGALEHAHAAGILHRDIKPSNVLLDEAGEPHLADFGLATALEGRGDLTEPGQLAGTRAYLAPELLGGAGSASPRSDVYSLGAVLFACLTGRAPFVADSAAALLRQVAEDLPLSPRLWQPEIPRDLETICLHCLEKAPALRYSSAAALEEDLRRFLRGEPIAARPMGRFGRAVRWTRRNPGTAAALGLGAALVLLLAVGGPLVAFRLERSRRAAADAAATSAELTCFFQDDLLAQASPDQQPDRELRLRTVLDRAAARIGERFRDRPLVEASIRQTLGETYLALGEDAAAERHLQRALDLRRRVLGAEDPVTLRTQSLLASVWIGLGRYGEAVALARTVAAAQHRLLGPENTDTLSTLTALGNALWRSGHYPEAEEMLARVLAARRRIGGPDDRGALPVLANLAAVRAEQGRYAAAESLYREGIALDRRLLGPENPQTLSLLNDLAVVYHREDKLAAAEALDREVLDLRRRTLGPEHPATLQSMNNLAGVYRYEGRPAEAEPLMAQVFETDRRIAGPEHPETLIAMVNLGIIQRDAGRYPQAERLLLQAVELRRRVSGPEHPHTSMTEAALVSVYKAEGRFAEAAALSRQVLATRLKILGPNHLDTLWGQSDLGDILLLDHRPEEARTVLQSALEHSLAAGLEPWRIALTRSRLGAALAAEGQYAAAEALLAQGYSGLNADLVHIPAIARFEVATARDRLGRCYAADGHADLAEKLFR